MTQLEKIAEETKRINKKLDWLINYVNEGFKRIEERLEKIEQNRIEDNIKINQRFEKIEQRLEKMEERLEIMERRIEERFEKMEQRFEKIEQRFKLLEKSRAR